MKNEMSVNSSKWFYCFFITSAIAFFVNPSTAYAQMTLNEFLTEFANFSRDFLDNNHKEKMANSQRTDSESKNENRIREFMEKIKPLTEEGTSLIKEKLPEIMQNRNTDITEAKHFKQQVTFSQWIVDTGAERPKNMNVSEHTFSKTIGVLDKNEHLKEVKYTFTVSTNSSQISIREETLGPGTISLFKRGVHVVSFQNIPLLIIKDGSKDDQSQSDLDICRYFDHTVPFQLRKELFEPLLFFNTAINQDHSLLFEQKEVRKKVAFIDALQPAALGSVLRSFEGPSPEAKVNEANYRVYAKILYDMLEQTLLLHKSNHDRPDPNEWNVLLFSDLKFRDIDLGNQGAMHAPLQLEVRYLLEHIFYALIQQIK